MTSVRATWIGDGSGRSPWKWQPGGYANDGHIHERGEHKARAKREMRQFHTSCDNRSWTRSMTPNPSTKCKHAIQTAHTFFQLSVVKNVQGKRVQPVLHTFPQQSLRQDMPCALGILQLRRCLLCMTLWS